MNNNDGDDNNVGVDVYGGVGGNMGDEWGGDITVTMDDGEYWVFDIYTYIYDGTWQLHIDVM